jgi:hypothetical protein
MDTKENIDREDWLRISKSGCSLKLGWHEKRIVASVPNGLVSNCNDQWLEDAQRLCDGWNELATLKAENASLRQQLTKPADDTISVSKGEWEAVSRDAERYKWLRDKSAPFEYLRTHNLPTVITLDTEVDRAMKNG